MLRRGIMVLVALALAGALTAAWTRGDFRDTVTVDAVVDDAGGSLTPGADVKSRGVIVGRTREISWGADGVHISLVLDADDARRIPRDAVARILPATVFGTSYVDLVAPQGAVTASLQDGQVVEQDRSARTLELQTTLDSLYRVVTSVKPAELSTTLAAISSALDGRGEEIGESMTRLDSYLSRLEPLLPTVQEDLRLLGDNLESLDRSAPILLDAVEDGLTTARTITAKRAQLTSIISGSGALVDGSETLLTSSEDGAVETIRQLARVSDVFHDERAQLAPGFLNFARFGRLGSTALSDGAYLNTDARVITTGGSPYGPEDCPRYGELGGDNCGGTSSGPASGDGRTTRADAESDAALVAQLRNRLAGLESDGGIGELLARPFIAGGAR